MINDNSPMPFGKYRGTAMANVPAPYLLAIHNKGWDYGEVRQYILVNLDYLIKENQKIPSKASYNHFR